MKNLEISNIILKHIPIYAPTTLMLKKLKLTSSMKCVCGRTRPSGTNTKKDVLYIIGNLNEKVRSQEIPGVTGKFGLGVQNEAGQSLTEFSQEKALIIVKTLFQ